MLDIFEDIGTVKASLKVASVSDNILGMVMWLDDQSISKILWQIIPAPFFGEK
jgi:hypothetical protein